MSKNLKITNLFKEKKKSNKRSNMKNTDGLDSDDEKLKEFESHQFKNLKIKFKNPKQKSRKTQKTLLDLKELKEPKESQYNDSKSTQAFSKKYENLIDELNTKNKNDDLKEIVMKDETNHKPTSIFELSSKTKNILNQVANKKREERQNKISNKENDSSLLLDIESKSKGKKLLFHDNAKKSPNNKLKSDSIFGNLKKNEPPKLSLKTLEIMKKLKEDRKNRFDRPENTDKNFRSDSSLSTLKFKYEELLTKPRELRLPIKYKQLFNTFMSLEQTISLNKVRQKNQMNTFDNIRNNVESVTRHSFNMKILQQILYIVPHFYILKYVEKQNKSTFNVNDVLNKDYDLIIDIPIDFSERINKNYPNNFNFLSINYYDNNNKEFNPIYTNLSINESLKRKEIFKNILNRIVNVYHNKYLAKNNIKLNFDPLKEKTWEHNFDPDAECEDIPLFEIPLPPNKCSVFQDIIMKNDIKNEIMKDALSMVNKSGEGEKNTSQNLNSNSNDKNNNYITPTKNKYVSQKFLDKIRAKEKANNIITEINNYNLFHNSFKDFNAIYKEILMQIKTILIVNKKSMELDKISEAVLNSSQLIKDNVVEKDKMIEIICKLCEKYNDCISLKKHSLLGKIVVLENTNFQIPDKISIDN